MNHSPERIPMITKAKKAATKMQETFIVYLDRDNNKFSFCSESEWDIMIDTNQVEPYWLEAIVTPEEPETTYPMVPGEGAPQYTFDVPSETQLSLL